MNYYPKKLILKKLRFIYVFAKYKIYVHNIVMHSHRLVHTHIHTHRERSTSHSSMSPQEANRQTEYVLSTQPDNQ